MEPFCQENLAEEGGKGERVDYAPAEEDGAQSRA